VQSVLATLVALAAVAFVIGGITGKALIDVGEIA